MGTIKERTVMDLREAEDIKKRWQLYTEELYKDLHDILECEVKWALGSITQIKLLEVMEFQLSYFKS